MTELIFLLVLGTIFVEALTEIIVASQIMARFRETAFKLNTKLGELVTCGYCTSVWIAASVAWIIDLGFHPVINYFLALFIIHRLSNIWHEAVVRWLNRAPFAFQINKTERIEYESPGFPETNTETASLTPTSEGEDQEFFSTEKID